MAHRLRIHLCVTVALIASPALAQGQEAPQDGDIVVTATRTETLASKTPIALTAIGAGRAARRGHSQPDAGSPTWFPTCRSTAPTGFRSRSAATSTDGTEKGDPSAAFLLDGVYIARPQAREVSFFDIERVEVLRGPQGTLFGRNTTAGAVQVISARPLDHFAASFDAAYGNFDAIQATAWSMCRSPAVSRCAARSITTAATGFVIQSPTSRPSSTPPRTICRPACRRCSARPRRQPSRQGRL